MKRASRSQWIFYFPLIGILYFLGEAAGVPDLTPILSPRQSYFMRRGFGDLSRCLILNQFVKKFNFSGNITYLCRTRAESFFQKIFQILLYAKFASPVPMVRHVTLYIRKVYDKSFYLNILLLQSFPSEPYLLIFSQQRNHSGNIFLYKFQIAWDWHLDA